MKNILLVFLSIGFLFSCENDDDSNDNVDLVGNWKLIEVYIDIGDGSGNFNPVESKKTITFKSDGTVLSNGSLCYPSTEIGNPTSGTYTKSTLSSADCNNPNFKYSFKINANILIIDYLCKEACKAKFIKI